jgi:DNA-binding winged helix-turn-helix (wHTH) protein
LDPYELFRNGQPVHLSATPHAVLYQLVLAQPSVMTRDELLDRVWGANTYVEPNAVDAAVSRLRMALTDNAKAPRYVRTVRKHGWRFVGQLRPVREELPLPHAFLRHY